MIITYYRMRDFPDNLLGSPPEKVESYLTEIKERYYEYYKRFQQI